MEATKKVRVGLLGAGWIGSHHAANLAANPSADLAAIFDPASQKATSVANSLAGEIKVCDSYGQMLEMEDIEAVVIATPNAFHAEHAILAAEHGKHIYLEKPMALTLEDCRAVVEAVRAAGVKCAMGYHRRINPLVCFAREAQAEGKLGDLVFAESEYIHHIPGEWDIWEWLGKEKVAGSLVHAGAGHNVDLLRYFCGEVREVSCFKDIRMPRSVQVETEDIAILNLRFEGGALGRVVLFVGSITPFIFTLRLFGTRGTLDNNRLWLDTFLLSSESGDHSGFIGLPADWIPDNVQGSIAEPWDRCLGEFIADVVADRTPANDAVSGFNTAAVCFAAVESALSGCVIAPERL